MSKKTSRKKATPKDPPPNCDALAAAVIAAAVALSDAQDEVLVKQADLDNALTAWRDAGCG